MAYQLSEWEVDTISDNLRNNDSGTITSYSGRAMYGDDCLGIVTDNVAKTMLLLASGLAEQGGRASDLLEALTTTSVREDSMGHRNVVYFPRITLPESFIDEDEEIED